MIPGGFLYASGKLLDEYGSYAKKARLTMYASFGLYVAHRVFIIFSDFLIIDKFLSISCVVTTVILMNFGIFYCAKAWKIRSNLKKIEEEYTKDRFEDVSSILGRDASSPVLASNAIFFKETRVFVFKICFLLISTFIFSCYGYYEIWKG